MMAKTYPPGVHQTSLFECADGEWIHAATMNGLTPPARPKRSWPRSGGSTGRLPRPGVARAATTHGSGRPTCGPVPRRADRGLPRGRLGRRGGDPDGRGLHPSPVRGQRSGGHRGGPRARGRPPRSASRPCCAVRRAASRAVSPGWARTAVKSWPRRDTPTRRSTGWWKPESWRRTRDGPAERCRACSIWASTWPGRMAPCCLADLGAEVIKVEPVRGDGMRMAGMAFVGCQRGKLDIAVDVKAPEGLEVVMRLAEIADVVHHNMTKGTAARLGIDYESLKARNPDLVHCNTYAYGAEGPLSEFGGLDPLYQAACGIEYEAGPVARGQPAPVSALRDDRHCQRHGVGRRRAGRPVPPTSYRRGSGPLDVAPQRRRGVRLRRLPGRGRTRPGSSRPRPQPDRGLAVLPALRDPAGLDPGGGVRGGAVVRSCAGSSAGPDLERFDTVEARVAARDEIEPVLEPVLSDADRRGLAGTTSPQPAWRPKSRSTPTTASSRSTTPTTSASAWWPNIRIRSWAGCANSARWSTSRRRRPDPTGRRRWWGSTPGRSWSDSGYSTEEIDDLLARGIVYEPTDGLSAGRSKPVDAVSRPLATARARPVGRHGTECPGRRGAHGACRAPVR